MKKNKNVVKQQGVGRLSPKSKIMKKEYIVESTVPIERIDDGEIYVKFFKSLPEARQFAGKLFREGSLSSLTNINGVRLTI